MSERLAELFEELGQRAEDLAGTAERSAVVHDQLPSHLLSHPDHADRERLLADAEHAAAQAYRAHQVPPSEVRAAIIRAGERGSTGADSERSNTKPTAESATDA